MLNLHTFDIDVVDEDLAFDNLNDPAKTEANRAFTGPSAAHNADSFASCGPETQIIEYNLGVRSVLEEHILELDIALLWPIWIPPFESIQAHMSINVFLRNSEQIQTPIRADHP